MNEAVSVLRQEKYVDSAGDGQCWGGRWVGKGGVLEGFWWWMAGAAWLEAPGDLQRERVGVFQERKQPDQRLGGESAGCRQR